MRKSRQYALGALLFTCAGAGAGIYYAQHAQSPVAARLSAIIDKPAATAIAWPVAVLDVAGGSSAGFDDPYGLVMDKQGNVYVADAGDSNCIRKIAPDGTVSALAGQSEGYADGSGSAASFNTPSGMAIDRAGNLYVADTGNNAIRKISPQGVVTTLAGTREAGFADGDAAQAKFNGPLGVAVDAAGNVYVADTYNDRIRKIGTDGKVTTVAGLDAPGYADGDATLAQFDTPAGIAVDAKGVLYVADTKNAAIRSNDTKGKVSTLAKLPDDTPKPLMRRPVSLAVAHDGVLFIGDMARGRVLQLTPDGLLHGLTGIGIDIEIGDSTSARLGRPTAIAIDGKGALLVADASNRVVRKLVPKAPGLVLAKPAPMTPPPKMDSFPWPFKPQNAWHEVVGIVGEVRGSYDGENRDHFHNGLDVQADMGEPVLAVADEKVSDPLPNWGYGSTGEGMALDHMAYIHMRVGRTVKDEAIDPARFTIYANEKGKPVRVRLKRGTRFKVGEPLGTVNRMFHVHLVYRTPGGEANPLQLPFPGFEDTIAPRVDGVYLVGADGQRLARGKKDKRLKVARDGGPLAIVVDAWDQADGNAKRRKLGLYEAGYQLLDAKGAPLPGFEKPQVNIVFDRLPPDQESVKLAYSNESGITVYGSKVTKFLYVVTNTVRDGAAKEGSWNPAQLAPGDYME
jgi:sugar lactone lactonase YvrE